MDVAERILREYMLGIAGRPESPDSLDRAAYRRRARWLLLVSLSAAGGGCTLLAPEQPPHAAPGSSKLPPLPTAPPGSAVADAPVAPTAAEASAPSAAEPAPVTPGVQRTLAPTRGALPKAIIEAGVSEQMPRIQACYARELAHRPGLRGSIAVNFVIGPDGSVPHAAALEESTTLENDAVIDCVLRVFRGMKFDAPSGGRAVATYPLNFEPQAAEPGEASSQ